MTRTRLRALQGMVFGTASALGWVLLEGVMGLHPVQGVLNEPLLYAYLLTGALSGFAIFGGLLGRSEDRLIELNAELDRLAVSDPLTGLRNVRYFRARLHEAQARARHRNAPLSLLVVDLDRFKDVNDRYGHPAGDQVLCAAARAISSVVRAGDTAARLEGAVARMGGEEFAVLLPDSRRGQAIGVAERVVDAVRGVCVRTDEGDVRVTASVGVASMEGAGAPEGELYAMADRAMYAAKAAGRDRVSAWPVAAPPPPPPAPARELRCV